MASARITVVVAATFIAVILAAAMAVVAAASVGAPLDATIVEVCSPGVSAGAHAGGEFDHGALSIQISRGEGSEENLQKTNPRSMCMYV